MTDRPARGRQFRMALTGTDPLDGAPIPEVLFADDPMAGLLS